MLRLPPFEYHRPTELAEALELLARHAGDVLPIAGGTDLMPNMKHRLFEPGHLVALKGVGELRGVEVVEAPTGVPEDQAGGDAGPLRPWLSIGAGETLTSVATHPQVRQWFPALADAAGHVAGPQLRNAGTIGGNLCLDTRCTYYNQTYFWRKALGYCLKKDGDRCHVTRVGKKCVAAHSADTPPVLMTLGAVADLAAPDGTTRTIPVEDFFVADGVWNTQRAPGELVVRIRIPRPRKGQRSGYAKLRQRKAIDFPLLTVAVSADFDDAGGIEGISGVVTALGSRPRVLTGWDDIAVGETLDDPVIDALAERAHAQCHPLENIVVDTEWRRAMVPVYTRRVLERVAGG